MNRQKFCVGENVAVRGVKSSKFDIDKTEVIEAKYFNSGDYIGNGINIVEAGWRYKTDHMPNEIKHKWFFERSLQKLPPDKESWNDCHFIPEQLKPQTQAELEDLAKLEKVRNAE